MRLRYVVLLVAVLLQLIASVALVAKLFGDRSTPAIADAKLAQAKAAYQRRQSQRSRQPQLPPPAPRPRTGASNSQPEPEPKPERPEPRERETASRQRPTLASQSSASDSSGELEVDDVRTPFDRGRFLEALDLAEEFLENKPNAEYHRYIRRVAVTSACAVGEMDTAREHYDQMNDQDKKTSEKRCARFGVEF